MTTNFDRRSLLKLGGSVLATTALTPHLAFAEAKTINYWHTFTSQSEQAGLDEVLKLFAAAHPDITVTPENIPNPEFMAKITAAVVANSRPSVTQVASERFRDLLAMGALTDITDRVTGWERRADFADQFPAILVKSPGIGQRISSPVTISGSADVFEAVVSIAILDEHGRTVASTFTMATCGTGCRGSYATDVRYHVGTRQPGTLRVYEVSAMDGSPIHVVEIPVILTP